MDAVAVARPYAAAAFAHARADGGVERWLGVLTAMAAAMAALAVRAAGGALVSAAQAAAVALAAADAVGGADAAVHRFVMVMAENDRMLAMPAVLARFDAMRREEAGIVAVRVVSALPIADREGFDRFLAARVGKTVESTYEEDAELLGGVRVYVGDYVIDASIRGRMDRLAETLTRGASAAS